MSNKKGPLGTPLGNPLKYFNDQKELTRADKGKIVVNEPVQDSTRVDLSPPPIDSSYLAPTTPGQLQDKFNPGNFDGGRFKEKSKLQEPFDR